MCEAAPQNAPQDAPQNAPQDALLNAPQDAPRFPLFISLRAKPVLVAGGGPVAARRARVLADFGGAVTVIAPELSPDMRALLGRVAWRREVWDGGLDEAYALVVAATNDRAVNRRLGEEAVRAGIPVSVADRKEESTFWFPAIMRGGGLIAGMISERGDHRGVKEAARKIRKSLEENP